LANCPCNLFPRFPTYVITIHERHRQTDRRTDRQTDTMQSQYRAMHCAHSASRGNNVCSIVLSLFFLPCRQSTYKCCGYLVKLRSYYC